MSDTHFLVPNRSTHILVLILLHTYSNITYNKIYGSSRLTKNARSKVSHDLSHILPYKKFMSDTHSFVPNTPVSSPFQGYIAYN